MSKSYRGFNLKKHRVYSVNELCAHFSAVKNTVSNWVEAGLPPSDKKTPHVFRGAVVNEFHKRNRENAKSPLLSGQFTCRSCQEAVRPCVETVTDLVAKNGKHMYGAKCPQCQSELRKISSEADRDIFQGRRNPNTPTDLGHEKNTSVCGSIGSEEQKLHTGNDRVLHKWQTYAGRYSEKTIDKHLAAIRFFERTLDGKPFANLTTGDFALFRDELKKRAVIGGDGSMSASSIKHTVSHITAFFKWLLEQDGFRRLPTDFSGYLELPRASLARSAQTRQKEYLSLAEAGEFLNNMPSSSLLDKRARAMFALAFLGALRADTLVSLRIKHFDQEKKLIVQDASTVRAKAGKSLNIAWFQIHADFSAAVLEWVGVLEGLGFTGEDALFPDSKYLTHRSGMSARSAVPVMASTYAVTHAFAIACRHSGTKYTPHSAKHTIGAERDIRSLTHEERKAWSLNMGHESELTTDRHYGTMSDQRRIDVLESIGSKKTIDPQTMSQAEKAEVFDTILSVLSERG